MKRTFPILALLAVTAQISAFGAAEFIPMHQFAEGHSLTGANLLNDSLYVNPAAAAFTRVYSIDATYQLSKRYAVSVLDTKNGAVNGALGYFRQPVSSSAFGDTFAEPMQGVKGALSARVSNNVAVGIAMKTMWGPRAQLGQTAATASQKDRLTDGDLGILGNFGMIQLGATLYNLVGGGNEALDPHQGREVSLGGRIGYQDLFFVSVATQSRFRTPTPYQYGIGAEYVSPYYFALKGGYRIVTDIGPQRTYWSAGFGINSPRVSVSYGVQFPQTDYERVEHVLGLMLMM